MSFDFGSNVKLSSYAEFLINYPSEVVDIENGKYGWLDILPVDDGTLGLKTVKLNSTTVKTGQIVFKTAIPKSEIVSRFLNIGLQISIDELVFTTEDGRPCKVSSSGCTMTFAGSAAGPRS